MENGSLRQRMGQNAKIEAQKYAPEKIYDAWEKLLYEAAACKGHTALQACLSGEYDNDPEKAKHAALLRKLLQRKNVLLRDDQWLRRFIRRYRWLTDLVRLARKFVTKITHKIQDSWK